MKSAKKSIALITAAVLALALTACSGSGSSSGTGTNSMAAAAAAETSAEKEETSLSGNIAVGGSTSMESVIGYLKEQFTDDNSGVSISYAGVGSGGGIEGVSNGTYDIGLSSRDLKAEEEEKGLVAATLALDGIAVIVNADNGIDNLSLEEITSIYNGEITNWSELGGDDLEIALIGREESSGTRDGFESITGTDGSHLDQELTSTGAVIAAVASSANAVGYSSLSAVEGQEGIKAVTVDGVECSEETILDGSYTIQRPFVLVTAEDTPLNEASQAFYDFCLSDSATELIRSAGAVPIR